MHRRVGFVVSACGMMFVLVPFATVLRRVDFLTCAVGFALVLIGVFFTIESVAKTHN